MDNTGTRSMSDSSNVNHTLTEMTATIAESYLANNPLSPDQVSGLLHSVHRSLKQTLDGQAEGQAAEAREPAVPIKQAVKRDHVACLECGKRMKMLKRHLRVAHDLDPQSYRERWGLSPDYPLVAPNYAAARSQLAKDIGLGKASAGS